MFPGCSVQSAWKLVTALDPRLSCAHSPCPLYIAHRQRAVGGITPKLLLLLLPPRETMREYFPLPVTRSSDGQIYICPFYTEFLYRGGKWVHLLSYIKPTTSYVHYICELLQDSPRLTDVCSVISYEIRMNSVEIGTNLLEKYSVKNKNADHLLYLTYPWSMVQHLTI